MKTFFFRCSGLIGALFAAVGVAGPPKLVNTLSSAFPPAATASGISGVPVASDDGQSLFFSSTARNIDPNGMGHRGLNIYATTNQGATARLLTPASAPGIAGDSTPVGVSGNTLVFLSISADLAPGATNGDRQLYALDLTTLQSRLLSHNATNGAPASAEVQEAAMPEGGRYVIFQTQANELGGFPQNRITQIYRCDLQNGDLIEPVSIQPGDASIESFDASNMISSRDGSKIAFLINLSGTSSIPPSNVVLRDMAAKESASILPAGAGTNLVHPIIATDIALSADGRYLAMRSQPSAPSKIGSIYWIDLLAGTNASTSFNAGGLVGRGAFNFSPMVFFPDGQTVAFEDLQTNGLPMVRFWSQRGVTGFNGFLTNTPALSDEPSDSSRLSLSGNGALAAFLSSATNIPGGGTDGLSHLYLRNLVTGDTIPVGKDPSGAAVAMDAAADYDFTRDEQNLLLTTSAVLSDGDYNRQADIYLFPLPNGELQAVSKPSAAEPNIAADGPPFIGAHCFSADGRLVVYLSYGSGSAANDRNNGRDVFLFDRQLNTTELISVNTNGTSSISGVCYAPQITPDGRHVLFLSSAQDLVPGPSLPGVRAYVRNIRNQTTYIASAADAKSGHPEPNQPMTMSDDGRFVVYQASPSDFSVLFDTLLGTWTNLPPDGASIVSNSGVLSADGTTAVWLQAGAGYSLGVIPTASRQFTYLRGLFSVRPTLPLMIDAQGKIVAAFLGNRSGRFLTANLASGSSNILSTPPEATNVAFSIMSRDGSTIVFESLVGAVHQLYSLQLASGKSTLLTTSIDGAPANGTSHNASISDDSRFVAFASDASDLTAGDTNGVADIFVRDMETGAIRVIRRTPGQPWAPLNAANPVICPDGSVVAFASGSLDFTPDVFSFLPQIYAAQIAPKLALSELTPAGASVAWESDAGVNYQIQYKNRLSENPWQPAGPEVSGDGGTLNEQIQISEAVRYFRVVEVP